MSTLYTLLCALIFTGSPIIAEVHRSTEVSTTYKEKSINMKKLVHAIILLGSTTSFLFWFPSTLSIIQDYGVIGACKSTHMLRLTLDLLIVVFFLHELLTEERV